MADRKCEKCGFVFPADQKCNVCDDCGEPAALTGVAASDNCATVPDKQAHRAIAVSFAALSRLGAEKEKPDGH